MTPDRMAMERALKAIVVPAIRSMGFQGAWPHFRLRASGENQLIMIFFNRYGGSFYIEGGRLSDEELQRKKDRWQERGSQLQEKELTVGHCARRLRFAPRRRAGDSWFKFGPARDEAGANGHAVKPADFYEAIAREALEALETDAPRFFGAAAAT